MMYKRLYQLVDFKGVIQSGDKFLYDYDHNIIIVDDFNFYLPYSQEYYNRFERLYRAYIEQKLGSSTKHLPFRFLLVLHELGHAMTYNKVTKEEIQRLQKEFESWRMFDNFHPDKWYYYRQMKHEKLADDWAIDFIRKNIRRVINDDNLSNACTSKYTSWRFHHGGRSRIYDSRTL